MLDWLTIASVVFSCFFPVFLSLCFLRIKNHRKTQCTFPTVSIVITSRNEEEDLPRCIRSLEKLSYPKAQLQVILVDDRSTDSTREIIKKAVAKNDHFELVTTDQYDGHLEAKARGLHCGIEKVRNEWILITDADAKLPEKWIETMITGADENVACVSGPLNVPSGKLRGIMEKLSYAFALPPAYGFSDVFKPFFCIGPNMGIRKQVYDQAGGLEKIDFKVAEDLAIFSMGQSSGLKTMYKANKDCLVEITPVPSLDHVHSQVMRWIGGAYEQGKEVSRIISPWFFFSFLTATILLFSHLWIDIRLFILLWIIKASSDTFALLIFYFKTKARNLIGYIPLFWFTSTLFFFVLPFLLLFHKKVTWKGQGYEVKY